MIAARSHAAIPRPRRRASLRWRYWRAILAFLAAFWTIVGFTIYEWLA